MIPQLTPEDYDRLSEPSPEAKREALKEHDDLAIYGSALMADDKRVEPSAWRRFAESYDRTVQVLINPPMVVPAGTKITADLLGHSFYATVSDDFRPVDDEMQEERSAALGVPLNVLREMAASFSSLTTQAQPKAEPNLDDDGWRAYRDSDPIPTGLVDVWLRGGEWMLGQRPECLSWRTDNGLSDIMAWRPSQAEPAPARKQPDLIAAFSRWQREERMRTALAAAADSLAGISTADRAGIDRMPKPEPKPEPAPVSTVKPAISGLGVTWARRGAPIMGGEQ